MDISKLIWPVTVIVSSSILAWSFFVVEKNKSDSIEKQQRAELTIQAEKNQQDTEIKKRDYIAKRKKDCLDIYEKELKQWNNINGWWYDEQTDLCNVEYKNQDWKKWDPGSSEYFNKYF